MEKCIRVGIKADIVMPNSDPKSMPPKWASNWLKLFCPPELYLEIEGDLLELYKERLEASNRFLATAYFLFEAFGTRKLNTLKYKTPNQNFKIMLLRNHIRSALRNMTGNSSFAILNIIGLALGMSASLLIFQYVKYERSFDSFHGKGSDIYRIQYNQYRGGSLVLECAAAVPAVGPSIKDNFSEVSQFTRLYPVFGGISYESPVQGLVTFREEKMHIADPAFFEVFDFQLIKGNSQTCLTGPSKVVITESAAVKYFGNEDPIGKIIKWTSNTWTFSGEREFVISGVMEDIPSNSHLKFNFLFSYQTINDQTQNQSEASWWWYDFYTYVLLKPGTDSKELQQKWNDHIAKSRGEQWESRGSKQEFVLQPMLDIHLYSDLLQESVPEELGDGEAVYFLTIMALLILIVAWVNYINLATAKTIERAKEVGIRKVLGAAKHQLRDQFIVEAALINFFSILLAIILVLVSWPLFEFITGRALPFSLALQPSFWFLAFGLLLVGILVSGVYPAYAFASVNPSVILNGRSLGLVSRSFMRRGLVVFQFFAAVVLISGALIVAKQLIFMKSQDLGVDLGETLVLEGPGLTVDSLYWQKLKTFKEEALKTNGVVGMTASSNVPGKEIIVTTGVRRSAASTEATTIYNLAIDYDYIPLFDLEVIAGRNFRDDSPADAEGVIINRALTKTLEFPSPAAAVGRNILMGRDTLKVLGVIEDYYQMSLKNSVSPIAMLLEPNNIDFYSFKVATGRTSEIIADIDAIWNQFFTGNPYDYFVLEDFFDRQYISDNNFGKAFGLFSMLTIFVACLGLFGLATFMNSRRRKEVGIRKALGSNVGSITVILVSNFVKLVLLGALFAIPTSWYIMSRWLENFPNRIELDPTLFILAAVIALIVAVFSIGYHTIKIALVNPAESLRYND